MCTYNFMLNDAMIAKIRPAFSSETAIHDWLQKQLETIVVQFAQSHPDVQSGDKNYDCKGDWRTWDISPDLLDAVSGTSKAQFNDNDPFYKDAITEAMVERYESLS